MPKPEPLEEDKKMTRREAGAAIKGDKILAQARKFVRKPLAVGSSSHRIQRYDLEGDAYCVIARPLRGLHLGKRTDGAHDP